MIPRFVTVLLLGYITTWGVLCSGLDTHSEGHEVTKRQVSQHYQRSNSAPQAPPEYLGLLQQLSPETKQTSDIRQFVVTRGSPQEAARYASSPQQYYQPDSSAYQLHQSRLASSLSGGSPTRATSSQIYQSEQSGGPTTEDLELRQQSILNAQQAALSFRQSYQSQQSGVQQPQAAAPEQAYQPPVTYQQQSVQQSGVKQLKPTYAASEQAYQPTRPESIAYQQQAYQQQAYQTAPAVQPTQQSAAAIQALYSPQQYQQQPSLQAYQQQANLAEQAAIAFQQAIQQQSRTGAQAQRPRLSTQQYILEQQHSYVVPSESTASRSRGPTVATPVVPTTEEYNLAAVQQAYQQIETAQQKAVEDIQRQPIQQRRPVAPTETIAYQEDEEGNIHIGDGDGFEFAKQPGATRQRQPAVLPTVRQPSVLPTVRQPQRTQQLVATYQQEQTYIPEQRAPVLPTLPPPQRQYVQVNQQVPTQQRAVAPTPEPQLQYIQPVAARDSRTRTLVSTIEPQRQYVQQQTIQRTVAPTERPVVPTVQIPRAQYTTPGVQFLPTPSPPSVARQPQPTPSEGKVGTIDLNLLRSLYAAAESLAKKQKDDVSPISEDELIKALLAQGRREQQAADILQKAAKQAPPPPSEEKDAVEVVRIPTPKNQRPITQEEFQALLQAGYDITPVEETPKASLAQSIDPIRAQYLRQAEFLEQQAQFKSRRASQQPPQAAAPLSRRARDEKSEQEKSTRE